MIIPEDGNTNLKRRRFNMPFNITTKLSSECETVDTGNTFHKRCQSFMGKMSVNSIHLPEIDKMLHPKPRTIADQLNELQSYERSSFERIKSTWNEGREKRSLRDSCWVEVPITSPWVDETGFSDEMILRFARCNNFDVSAALNAMNKMDLRFLTLTCESLEKQLLKKTLFIPPGLKNRDGNDVFYMRPARYFPGVMEVDDVINNLAYCMQTMYESKDCSKNGIVFLADMSGWTRINFSVDYCLRFMTTLQGRNLPVNVNSFLIVDPPNWFGQVWKMMKTMLSPNFQMKVHMISSKDLHMYLQDGYSRYLPDEMDQGRRPTDDIVTKYIVERKKIEECGEEKSVRRVCV